ncbi:MAG: SsrA-binding protein SmpB [Planctomycetia bacterium]|nr:SsrA-binding protein SmpB [Planctomycetia bacterium]
MAKSKTTKKKAKDAANGEKIVCENRKARHDYNILESVECGMVLVGSEVKSLREGRCSLVEAYARVKEGEVWLLGCDIQEYLEANRLNHQPKRPRKLLLHRSEIRKLGVRTAAKGLTLIPLRVYFSKGLAKVLLGVCQGKREYDKRQALKTADANRRLKLNMMRFK